MYKSPSNSQHLLLRRIPIVKHKKVLLLLLLQLLFVQAPYLDIKNWNKSRKEALSFDFVGAIIGGTNGGTYNVKIECNACTKMVYKTQSADDAGHGLFKMHLTLDHGETVVDNLIVEVTSERMLGGQKRSNRWELTKPKLARHYAFFMGEFEPKIIETQKKTHRLLFLRALFTKELRDLGKDMAFLLRLTDKESSKIYGQAEISNDRRAEWSNSEADGIFLRLNTDGIYYVRQNKAPNMWLRLYDISANECSICHNVFRNGIEPARRLFNCLHYNHGMCINRLLIHDKKSQCPICRAAIALIKQPAVDQLQVAGISSKTDGSEEEEKREDAKVTAQGGAKVVTRELNPEGSAIEKHLEYITRDELERVRQSQIDNLTTEDGSLVYFKEIEKPLTEMFAFNIVKPVFQNGSGRPKFIYKLSPKFGAEIRDLAVIERQLTKDMFNQSVKSLDNEKQLNEMFAEKDEENKFEALDYDSTDDAMLPPAADEGSDQDPDLHAVQTIPDIDVPPSPPDSDEIVAGIRTAPPPPATTTGSWGKKHDASGAASSSAAAYHKHHKQKPTENVWAPPADYCSDDEEGRERGTPTAKRSIAGSSNASPARSWRGEISNLHRAPQHNDDHTSKRSEMGGDDDEDDDGPPIWDLLAQSSRSSARSTPSRFSHHNYERKKAATDEAGRPTNIAVASIKKAAEVGQPSEAAKPSAESEPPGLIEAMGNLWQDLKRIYNEKEQKGGDKSAGSKTANDAAKANKRHGFTMKILPELENDEKQRGAAQWHYEVQVKCAWEKEFDGISVTVKGNEAKIEYIYDSQLVFFDLTVWKKSSKSDTNQDFAPFVEQNVEIQNGEMHTFYMGAHFTLSIAGDGGSVSQMPGTQLLLRRIEPSNYIVQVNCHGERSPGFRSETATAADNKSNNGENIFDVFLPEKRCTNFDIYVGKVHVNKLLAKAVEKDISIKKGEKYVFKKAFVRAADANKREQKPKEEQNANKNLNFAAQMSENQNNATTTKHQQQNEMDNAYDEEEDPELERAILESLKDENKRKGKQKMQPEQEEEEQQMPAGKMAKYGGIAAGELHSGGGGGGGGPPKVPMAATAEAEDRRNTNNNSRSSEWEEKHLEDANSKEEERERAKLINKKQKMLEKSGGKSEMKQKKVAKSLKIRKYENETDDSEELMPEDIELQRTKERLLRRYKILQKQKATTMPNLVEQKDSSKNKSKSAEKSDEFETADEKENKREGEKEVPKRDDSEKRDKKKTDKAKKEKAKSDERKAQKIVIEHQQNMEQRAENMKDIKEQLEKIFGGSDNLEKKMREIVEREKHSPSGSGISLAKQLLNEMMLKESERNQSMGKTKSTSTKSEKNTRNANNDGIAHSSPLLKDPKAMTKRRQ